MKYIQTHAYGGIYPVLQLYRLNACMHIQFHDSMARNETKTIPARYRSLFGTINIQYAAWYRSNAYPFEAILKRVCFRLGKQVHAWCTDTAVCVEATPALFALAALFAFPLRGRDRFLFGMDIS